MLRYIRLYYTKQDILALGSIKQERESALLYYTI